MQWSLSLLFLTCLPPGAASFLFSNQFGSNVIGSPGAPGAPAPATGDMLFTFDINDRSDLVAGLPIHVTFTVQTFQAPAYTVWVESTGTFRDTFTVTAVLGGQTGSVMSNTHESLFTAAASPQVMPGPGPFFTATFPGPFSLTVPWDTDLTALSVKVTQTITFDGAGNGILFAGAGGPLNVTTQSVPEPGPCASLLAAGA